MTIRVRLHGLFRPRTAYRVAAAAAALVTISAVAACGSSGGSAATAPTPRPRGASGASGTLNWEWELPTSWDPVTSSAGWDVHVLGLVYASITTLDPRHGRGRPGQLVEVRRERQERDVHAAARPEVHRRHALNAHAVKENIERGQNQSNSTIASELAVISKVVVNSPTSFTLDLTQVDYQVPDLLAGKDGMMVSPAAFKNAGACRPSRSAPARSS